MARLWLIAVLLLLSAGSSLENPENPPKPNLKEMKEIVDDLWDRYHPSYISSLKNKEGKYPRRYPMYSLAVSIPYDNNKKEYDVSKVTDSSDVVKNRIIGCDVYSSKTMVAATVLKWPNVVDQCPNAQVPWKAVLDKDEHVKQPWTDVLQKCPNTRRPKTWAQVEKQCPPAEGTSEGDHAEYRVLQNFKTLTDNTKNKQDFLLFYVYASPCYKKCASVGTFSILDSIKKIRKWENYAVVFSKVFQPTDGSGTKGEDLKAALERLGDQIGLQNIYRCDDKVPCKSCSNDNDVELHCYINAHTPAPSNNAPSTSVNVPQAAKANVPSQTGEKRGRASSTDDDDGQGKLIPDSKKGKNG